MNIFLAIDIRIKDRETSLPLPLLIVDVKVQKKQEIVMSETRGLG
jgi:hypothetical protein